MKSTFAAILRRQFPGLYAHLKLRLPRSTMLAAHVRAQSGDHEGAIHFARRRLKPAQAHAISILEANHALALGDQHGWLTHLNAYLAHFNEAPLQLESDEAAPLLTRLGTAPLAPVTGGPLVSVLMPAWNAEATIAAAARSILNQTWRNLELLIVDDASEDGTWRIMQDLATHDSRVRIRRNQVNVGPYVSKNIALTGAKGDWITGHDADDWAHPRRLARHVAMAMERRVPASVLHMLRVRPDGHVSRTSAISENAPDGVAQICFVSCLFDAGFLREQLGAWDSVRFAADSEIMARATTLMGGKLTRIPVIGLVCLDLPGGLTNHASSGMSQLTGLSPVRQSYRNAFLDWHRSKASGPSEQTRLAFPLHQRPFPAPAEMVVSVADVAANLGVDGGHER